MSWFGRWRKQPPGGPQGGDAAVRRALLAVLDRDLPSAEKLLAGAARQDSQDVDAWLALARVYRQRGEIGRAIHIHQNLLLRDEIGTEARREALLELAADFRQGGFLRRAIASYEEVLSQDRRSRPALAALSRLHCDVRNFEAAIDAERRLAKLEGRDAAAIEASLWVDVASSARAEGQPADARRALRRALRRDKDCVRAWIALGDVEAERGKTRAALAAWRRVPALDRRRAVEIYPRLVACLADAGRSAEHEPFLRGLVESDPDDPGARLALARTLAADAQPDEAVAEIRRLLERGPDNLEAYGTLGRVLLAEHRDPEAIKTFAELLEVLERGGLLRPRESSR